MRRAATVRRPSASEMLVVIARMSQVQFVLPRMNIKDRIESACSGCCIDASESLGEVFGGQDGAGRVSSKLPELQRQGDQRAALLLSRWSSEIFAF
jgi:hypothetical protein